MLKTLFVQWFGRSKMALRLMLLCLSVIVMGLCVTIFDTLHVGTDPCSSFNLGFSRVLGWRFGSVGFSADLFFPWTRRIIPASLSPVQTGLILIPSMALFVLAVAVYMVVDLGSAPYDALPMLIARHWFPGKVRLIRILWDLAFVVMSLLCHGSVGIMTALCIGCLGPVIALVTERFGAYFAD